MKKFYLLVLLFGICAWIPKAFGDQIVLKSGKRVSGQLMKVTKTHVYFKVGSGKTYKIGRKKIKKFVRSKNSRRRSRRRRRSQPKAQERSESEYASSERSDVSIGVRIGGNLGDASVVTSNAAVTGKSAYFGFSFGGVAQFALSKSASLQFELAYSQLGVTLTTAGSPIEEVYNILELPVLLKYAITSGKYRLYAAAGGFLGIGAGATTDGTAISTASSIHFGLMGGAGVDLQMGESMFLDLGTRFLFSLSDADTSATESRTLTALQFYGNIMFLI